MIVMEIEIEIENIISPVMSYLFRTYYILPIVFFFFFLSNINVSPMEEDIDANVSLELERNINFLSNEKRKYYCATTIVGRPRLETPYCSRDTVPT